jgi:hypothetical protein
MDLKAFTIVTNGISLVRWGINKQKKFNANFVKEINSKFCSNNH